MRSRGFAVAIAVGALLAVVALVAVYFAIQGTGDRGPLVSGNRERGVIVALVLPDANGTQGTRLIAYYPPGSGPGRVVDPLAPAVVAGTSAGTLGESLTFGGGSALAEAYAAIANVPKPGWIVVDEDAWAKLVPQGVSVSLPRPVDVYNGRDLVTFPAGEVAVSAADTGVLLAAIHALPRSDRASVLGSVSAALQRGLGSSKAETGLDSDLSARPLRTWLWSLPARSQPETRTR